MQKNRHGFCASFWASGATIGSSGFARLPPPFRILPKSDSLLSEVHTRSYSPSESSVLNVTAPEPKHLKANRGHHDGSQVNAAAPIMAPPWLGFTMTFHRSKPQPRHGALEKCVVRGTGPAPLRLGSWPHVLSSGVRVLPLFLRLGSWPYVLSSPRLFESCRKVTLCYQRFTHTATPLRVVC